MDTGDQIAPTSPQGSRRVVHVSEQIDLLVDPILHHQVLRPKEDFEFNNNDFICPICFEVMKDPFITRCGHTYCYNCIVTSIKSNARCPMCKEVLNEDELIANVLLSEVIYKFRKQQEAENLRVRELPEKSKEEVVDLLKSFDSSAKESVLASLVHMMKTDKEQKKITERENMIVF